MGTRWHRGATLLGTGIVSAGLIFGSSTIATAAPHDSADDVPITQTNLVSDQVGHAPLVDANLVNPWGMSFGAATPVWVSDNGKDVSTLYSGNTFPPAFTKANLTVSIPFGAPTGQVNNTSATDFVVTNGTSGPAKFIFASEEGWITGWNPNVPAAGSTQATPAKRIANAVFKGLALANFDGAKYLYATDFNHARVLVFDSTFGLQHWDGAFHDSAIPSGYAPFNVQLLNGNLYVTYAKQNAAKHDDVAGRGHGFVDVFTTGGQLVKRLVRNGDLNSPWGVAIAPSSWGELAGSLLVGNFGNGQIHAYNATTGAPLGALKDNDGNVLAIDGLWGLLPGNGVASDPQSVIFSAGPDGEKHGLVGVLQASA